MKTLSRAFELAALALALITSGCADGEGADDLPSSLSSDPGKTTAPANDATKPGAPDPNHPSTGCATPPPLKCGVETGPNGEMCKACYDVSGKVVVRECSPPSDVKCQEEKGPEGERCKACYDANGKVVYRECGPGNPPPPPAKCVVQEEKDGTVCQVCYDAATGKELSRACKNPGAGGGRCEEVKAGDLLCKVCYDASGAPVTKECAKP